MSLLTTIQRFCRRRNIPVPSTVLGSTDDQVKQAYSILEEEIDELSDRGDWQELTFEATHTTVATESQGNIEDIAANGFNYIKNGTIWDRDEQLPVYVVDGTDWQQLKAIQVTGPRYQARLRGGELLANPTPAAGLTWAFEYVSKYPITDSTGATYREYFEDDADEILLPNKIVLMGLTWRWKKEKGLTYAEDFNTYERMVLNALGRDGMKRVLNMSVRHKAPNPSIYVPDGSWNL